MIRIISKMLKNDIGSFYSNEHIKTAMSLCGFESITNNDNEFNLMYRIGERLLTFITLKENRKYNKKFLQVKG